MGSLFKILDKENLTTLVICYSHKKDTFRIEARKDWDENTVFAEYNRDFYRKDILTEEKAVLNIDQFEALVRDHEALDYFEKIKELIRAGKHEAVKLYYNSKLGIQFAIFEHNTVLGRSNRLHAVTCGGIRRHNIDTPEMEVFIDGLNLGRAMAFKNAGARIPFGGSKITVQAEKLDLNDNDVLGFLGYATDCCNVLTAPDMNLPPAISDLMLERNYSHSYVGGEHSKTGKTGKPTAYGVYLSLKEAVKFQEGEDTLKGKSILVIGLGAVGWNMAEYVLDEGAELTICDINDERIKSFLEKQPRRDIQTVKPENALTGSYEIISPCAAGGLLDENSIAKLRCKYIWGSANNQLKAADIKEEYRLARLLHDRGILYQPEWWHNSAGVITMAEEYIHGSTPEEVLARVKTVIPKTTCENLREAKAKGITPTENCYRKIESQIL